MASHVVVALDTTAPLLGVGHAQAPGDLTLVTLNLTTDDAAEVRVWGAIDPTDPANADYGETQGAAPWIPFDASLVVRVVTNGGTLYVQARDDVHNEGAAVASVIDTGGVTPPEPQPEPPRRGGLPQDRRQKVARRKVTTRSTLRVRSSSRISVHGTERREGEGPSLRPISATAVRGSRRSLAASRAPSVTAATRRRAMRSGVAALNPVASAVTHKRPEGPRAEEDLDILGLI